MLAPSEHSSRATKEQSYVFAIIFGVVILALIIVFNLRSEQIEKIARTFLGSPK